MLAEALRYGDAARQLYRLRAWVVMPNHVHLILEPRVPMAAITRWLKGRTSRVANRVLNRGGLPFWQDESFDHWVRSQEELRYLVGYVEENPVSARLVKRKEDWPWSSASGARGPSGADHRFSWSASSPAQTDADD